MFTVILVVILASLTPPWLALIDFGRFIMAKIKAKTIVTKIKAKTIEKSMVGDSNCDRRFVSLVMLFYFRKKERASSS